MPTLLRYLNGTPAAVVAISACLLSFVVVAIASPKGSPVLGILLASVFWLALSIAGIVVNRKAPVALVIFSTCAIGNAWLLFGLSWPFLLGAFASIAA